MKEIWCPICEDKHDKIAELEFIKKTSIPPSYVDEDHFPFTIERRKYIGLCPETFKPITLIVEEYKNSEGEQIKSYKIRGGLNNWI